MTKWLERTGKQQKPRVFRETFDCSNFVLDRDREVGTSGKVKISLFHTYITLYNYKYNNVFDNREAETDGKLIDAISGM